MFRHGVLNQDTEKGLRRRATPHVTIVTGRLMVVRPLWSVSGGDGAHSGAPPLLAGPRDIGLMKLLAICHRATPRDYIHLAALLRHGCSLPDLLAASERKYGSGLDLMVPLRALTAFEDVDGEVPTVLDPGLAAWKDILRRAARDAALGP